MATYTNNFSLTEPAYGDKADIGAINQGVTEKVDRQLYRNRAVSAPMYDPSEGNVIGDLRINGTDGLLYKCTAPTSGVWDSAKWTLTDLASELENSGSASALSDLTDVDLTSPTDGQILTYDGDEWVNADAPDVDVTKTAEGNPIEITDGASAPMVKCVTQITGYQSGSGTPSPDNIRPITAYTEGEIVVSDGDGNTTTHTTTFPSAIYRGSEDVVNGEVVTEWGMIASYAGETLPGEWISDRDEYVPGTTPTTGAQVAYALATPTTSSVTPNNLPIKSLSGYNHIESSTGEMEVEYITEEYQPLVDLMQKEQGHIYSTSEQVVGTWTDGKTIYEKTVVSELALTSSWQQYLSSADMETIVSVDARYTRDDEDVPGAFSNYEVASWINRSGYIQVCGQGNASSGWKIQSLTIRYTKTSNRSLNASLTRSTAQISEETNEVEETPTEEENAENEANNEVTEEPKEEMR